MKIAVCGPATLSMLTEFVGQAISLRGYPFPGMSELVIEYLKLGHSVTLITTDPEIDKPVSFCGEKLRIVIVPSRPRARSRALDFFLRERRGIRKALLDTDADVVHGHWTYEFGLATRASGIPSLVTVHDWAPAVATNNKHVYWYFRAVMQVWCLTLPGELTAPTNYLGQMVKRTYLRNCHIIPNGVVLDGGNRDWAPRTPGAVGMLNAGFSDRKNVKAALIAWKSLRASHPQSKLHLAGPGYEVGGPAYVWAASQGCCEGVVFEGALDPDQRMRWYRDKEIFLHSSREESFGMVLIEAMAAGTPVIAGRYSGAVPEITLGAALLVDVDRPHEIAAGIAQLLGDAELREAHSLAGIRVAAKYDLRVIAKKYLTVLQGLAKPQYL